MPRLVVNRVGKGVFDNWQRATDGDEDAAWEDVWVDLLHHEQYGLSHRVDTGIRDNDQRAPDPVAFERFFAYAEDVDGEKRMTAKGTLNPCCSVECSGSHWLGLGLH